MKWSNHLCLTAFVSLTTGCGSPNPICGNNTLEAGEGCDDNNLIVGDGCDAQCQPEVVGPICGDGEQEGGEVCDDGNALSGDGCRADCLGLELCGDGLIDPGEGCDDGNQVESDGCNNDCTLSGCDRDGLLESGELCFFPDALPTGFQPGAILSGDFDSDGQLDLLLPINSFTENLLLLLGNGDGTFFSSLQETDSLASLRSLDLDSDGDLDLIATSFDQVSIQRNLGGGLFAAPELLADSNGDGFFAAEVGDMDGDGDLDLVVAGFSDAFIFLNDGGDFAAPQQFAMGVGPQGITLANVDGDSDLDLIGAFSGSVRVLRNQGDGSLDAAQSFAAVNTPSAVRVGDVDGDGDPEIVLTNRSTDQLAVLLNSGANTFEAPQLFAVGQRPEALALRDLDGDGDLDVFTANQNSNDVSHLINNGGALQPAQSVRAGQGPIDLLFADIDGDSLLVSNQRSGDISVLKAQPDGSLLAPFQDFSPTGLGPFSADAADLDGDGDIDMVAAAQSGGLTLLLNNGDGSFLTQSFAAGTILTKVLLRDLNNDGDLDIIVGDGGSGSVLVLLNDGNASFAAPVSSSIGNAQPNSIELGDTNDDGQLDLLLTLSGGRVAISLGQGTSFAAPQILVNSGASGSALADLNGDGALDIAFAGNATNSAIILLNQGGSFGAPISFPAVEFPTDIAIGDLNGDGSPDLALSSFGADRVSVLFNLGAGAFGAPSFFAAGVAPGEIALDDLDQDADLEIVVSNRRAGVSALLNQSGGFSPPVSFPGSGTIESVVLADLNGDEAPEIVLVEANSSGLRVLRNQP